MNIQFKNQSPQHFSQNNIKSSNKLFELSEAVDIKFKPVSDGKQKANDFNFDDRIKDLERKLDDSDNDSLSEYRKYQIRIENRGFFNRLRETISKCRNIQQDGRPRIIEIGKPQKTAPNIVKNQKYSILSFLPLVLFDQFRYFFNFFFLLITLSQFIPMFKVGFLFSYVAPLAFVLTLTMLKEAFDDFKRYRRDNQANSYIYTLQDGRSVKSLNIRVGDVVKVNVNERVPADMILLTTSEMNSCVFIRTDQLDGETDWKLRHAVKSERGYEMLVVEPPKLDIYEFKGVIKSEAHRELLSLENTVWANTFIAAGSIMGIVIYTGKETRSAMNSREARYKMGRLDKELNFLSKVLFVFMCLLSTVIVLVSWGEGWALQFFRHVLLLSSIIPISLRVNLDFSKLAFSYKIDSDPVINGAKARNSQIPEELGRISYVMSDKTGTLTQNSMILKRLSLENCQFTSRQTNQIIKMIKKPNKSKKLFLNELILSLSVCHNVTPINDGKERTFQASSPDEIALVNFAALVGLHLEQRTFDTVVVKSGENLLSFKILNEFPFTSERKRMGIILQNQEGEITFYLKGADAVMKSCVPEVQRGFLLDECESLSREGLRTLVICQKVLSAQEYSEWNKQFEDEKAQMLSGESALQQLEQNMELLGITGVEDKLQDQIFHTIEQLRGAGIKIWMLTGDKLETAQCISISAGLKQASSDIFTIREVTDPITLSNLLNQVQIESSVIAIDGTSLQLALKDCLNSFLNVACLAPAVICCRCSPTQKAQIVEAIKKHTQLSVLAIGDGGNDVAMIQAADVGVGIEGKEGRQAALASDFSITKFEHLSSLLLWHGRLAYTRCSVMSQFVMHRGLVISVIQCIFTLVFYQIALPIYNGWLMLGYATVYTMLPVFCLIFDEDVSREKAMDYPQLYQTLLKGRYLTWKTFLLWLWKSIYQGTVIMALSFYFINDTFLHLVTVTFSALIIIELLNVYTELHRLRVVTIISQLLTFTVYFLSIYFLRQYINTADLTLMFFLNVLILVIVSWLPLHIGKMIITSKYPTDSDKIMMKIHTHN